MATWTEVSFPELCEYIDEVKTTKRNTFCPYRCCQKPLDYLNCDLIQLRLWFNVCKEHLNGMMELLSLNKVMQICIYLSNDQVEARTGTPMD